MTEHITTPEESKAPDTSKRLSRKQFNSFLYRLYGCKENNDVKADYIYESAEEDEDRDFFVEVFLNLPAGGTMIAIHHDPMMNSVDVFTFSERLVDDASQSEAA